MYLKLNNCDKSRFDDRNRNLEIFKTPTQAKSQEQAYSQALIQNKIDMADWREVIYECILGQYGKKWHSWRCVKADYNVLYFILPIFKDDSKHLYSIIVLYPNTIALYNMLNCST